MGKPSILPPLKSHLVCVALMCTASRCKKEFVGVFFARRTNTDENHWHIWLLTMQLGESRAWVNQLCWGTNGKCKSMKVEVRFKVFVVPIAYTTQDVINRTSSTIPL